MSSYAEQIAAWRQQRAQQQISNRLEEIKVEHRERARERDQAIQDNDIEAAELADMDCQQLEAEWNHYNPPGQQIDPRVVEFVKRRAPFVDRHGAAAMEAMSLAHQYATRPRVPNATNPAATGMGLRPNTPQYFKAMDDLLSMYAKDYGLRYDPEETALTATEAAKISGLSADHYNASARQLWGQGRFSSQQKK